MSMPTMCLYKSLEHAQCLLAPIHVVPVTTATDMPQSGAGMQHDVLTSSCCDCKVLSADHLVCCAAPVTVKSVGCVQQ